MAKDKSPEFIVAEVVVNWPKPWPAQPCDYISAKFEAVIEHNRGRGYRLHSWQLHRLAMGPDKVNETIIAVFHAKGKGEAT